MHWVFIAVLGLSAVSVRRGHYLLQCADFSLQWLLLLQSTGSRHSGSVVVAHKPSCLQYVESSLTRDWTHVPCIGRWIHIHVPPGKSEFRILVRKVNFKHFQWQEERNWSAVSWHLFPASIRRHQGRSLNSHIRTYTNSWLDSTYRESSHLFLPLLWKIWEMTTSKNLEKYWQDGRNRFLDNFKNNCQWLEINQKKE